MKTYFIKDDDFSENDHQMNESATRFDKQQAKNKLFYFYTHVDNKKKTVTLFYNTKDWNAKQMSYADARKQFDDLEKEIAHTNTDIYMLYRDASKYGYTIL